MNDERGLSLEIGFLPHLAAVLGLPGTLWTNSPYLLPCRGIVLFRPPRLTNKFEESSIKYSEDKITSGKIKKFIQENMWVIPHPQMWQTGSSWLCPCQSLFSQLALLPLPAACLGTASLWGHLLEIPAWLLACTLRILTMILFKNGICENCASFGLTWVSFSHWCGWRWRFDSE